MQKIVTKDGIELLIYQFIGPLKNVYGDVVPTYQCLYPNGSVRLLSYDEIDIFVIENTGAQQLDDAIKEVLPKLKEAIEWAIDRAEKIKQREAERDAEIDYEHAKVGDEVLIYVDMHWSVINPEDSIIYHGTGKEEYFPIVVKITKIEDFMCYGDCISKSDIIFHDSEIYQVIRNARHGRI